ncbi:MAG: hypothetical protein H6706_25435 [Myxococcales bacterium]|nr:hypothetical protein [Myxococcales bacterium]
MRTLILGDLHLGDGGPWDLFAGHQALPALLESCTTPPTRVILNGDALDFLRAEARVTGLDPQPAARQAEAIVRRWRPVFLALGRVLDGGGEVVFRLGSRDAPLALAAVQGVIRRALGDRRGVRFERGDRPALLRFGTARVLVTHGAHADPLERLDYRRLPEDGESTPFFRLGRGAWLTRNVLHPLLEQGVALAGLVGPAADRGVLAAAAVAPAAFARVVAERGLRIRWDDRPAEPDPADLTPVIERLDLDAVDRAELREALERGGLGTGISAWQIRALRAFAEVHGAAEGGAFDLRPLPDDAREARRLRRIHEADAVVLGHRHAAAFFNDDGLLHVNAGGWLPRLRLPPPDADDARFRDLLELLQADPRLVAGARRLRVPVFTAALVEPEGEGAVASLVAWRDGRLQVVEAGGVACRSFVGTGTTSFAVRTPEARQRCRPLLATADTGDPLLDVGLAPEPGLLFPVARHPSGWSRALGAPGDPHDLAEQLWGVVVAAGRWGVYRDALAPLVALREAQMDAHAPVLEVDPGLVADVPGAVAWMRDAWQQLPVHRRPGYLLLLGDLDELPLALQQVLGSACAVGRLAFTGADGAPRLDQYRAYADKVVRHAWHPLAARRVPLLLHIAEDGSRAVDAGLRALLDPGAGALGRDSAQPYASVQRVEAEGLVPDAAPLLRQADAAAVLWTLGHAIGPPPAGWDGATRRRLQGAISLGNGALLTAEAVARRPFLPGGIWLLFASFSAATPAASVYTPWLAGQPGPDAARLLQATAGAPFVAALPQAALANPFGPLAVIGLCDLAWTPGSRVAVTDDLAWHERLTQVLAALGPGPRGRHEPGRVGMALLHHARAIPAYEAALAAHRTAPGGTEEHDRQDGLLWLARQDLDCYLLLGDPAARLPLATVATQVERRPDEGRATVPEAAPTPAEPLRTWLHAHEDALLQRARALALAALAAEVPDPEAAWQRAQAHLAGEAVGRTAALHAEIALAAIRRGLGLTVDA